MHDCQHTYSPRITAAGRATQNMPLQERSQRVIEERNRRLARSREQVEMGRKKDMTFTPRINNSSSAGGGACYGGGSGGGGHGNEKENLPPAHERLYNRAKQREVEMNALREQAYNVPVAAGTPTKPPLTPRQPKAQQQQQQPANDDEHRLQQFFHKHASGEGLMTYCDLHLCLCAMGLFRALGASGKPRDEVEQDKKRLTDKIWGTMRAGEREGATGVGLAMFVKVTTALLAHNRQQQQQQQQQQQHAARTHNPHSHQPPPRGNAYANDAAAADEEGGEADLYGNEDHGNADDDDLTAAPPPQPHRVPVPSTVAASPPPQPRARSTEGEYREHEDVPPLAGRRGSVGGVPLPFPRKVQGVSTTSSAPAGTQSPRGRAGAAAAPQQRSASRQPQPQPQPRYNSREREGVAGSRTASPCRSASGSVGGAAPTHSSGLMTAAQASINLAAAAAKKTNWKAFEKRKQEELQKMQQRRTELESQARSATSTECTFHPTINNYTPPVNAPRVPQDKPKDSHTPREEKDMEECTFHPQVHDVPHGIYEVPVPQAPGFNRAVQRMVKGRETVVKKFEDVLRSTTPPPKSVGRTATPNKTQPKPFKFQTEKRERSKPLLYVDVNLGAGRVGRIGIHHGDKVDVLAANFAQTYGLDRKMEVRLAKILEDQLARSAGPAAVAAATQRAGHTSTAPGATTANHIHTRRSSSTSGRVASGAARRGSVGGESVHQPLPTTPRQRAGSGHAGTPKQAHQPPPPRSTTPITGERAAAVAARQAAAAAAAKQRSSSAAAAKQQLLQQQQQRASTGRASSSRAGAGRQYAPHADDTHPHPLSPLTRAFETQPHMRAPRDAAGTSATRSVPSTPASPAAAAAPAAWQVSTTPPRPPTRRAIPDVPSYDHEVLPHTGGACDDIDALLDMEGLSGGDIEGATRGYGPHDPDVHPALAHDGYAGGDGESAQTTPRPRAELPARPMHQQQPVELFAAPGALEGIELYRAESRGREDARGTENGVEDGRGDLDYEYDHAAAEPHDNDDWVLHPGFQPNPAVQKIVAPYAGGGGNGDGGAGRVDAQMPVVTMRHGFNHRRDHMDPHTAEHADDVQSLRGRSPAPTGVPASVADVDADAHGFAGEGGEDDGIQLMAVPATSEQRPHRQPPPPPPRAPASDDVSDAANGSRYIVSAGGAAGGYHAVQGPPQTQAHAAHHSHHQTPTTTDAFEGDDWDLPRRPDVRGSGAAPHTPLVLPAAAAPQQQRQQPPAAERAGSSARSERPPVYTSRPGSAAGEEVGYDAEQFVYDELAGVGVDAGAPHHHRSPVMHDAYGNSNNNAAYDSSHAPPPMYPPPPPLVIPAGSSGGVRGEQQHHYDAQGEAPMAMQATPQRMPLPGSEPSPCAVDATPVGTAARHAGTAFTATGFSPAPRNCWGEGPGGAGHAGDDSVDLCPDTSALGKLFTNLEGMGGRGEEERRERSTSNASSIPFPTSREPSRANAPGLAGFPSRNPHSPPAPHTPVRLPRHPSPSPSPGGAAGRERMLEQARAAVRGELASPHRQQLQVQQPQHIPEYAEIQAF